MLCVGKINPLDGPWLGLEDLPNAEKWPSAVTTAVRIRLCWNESLLRSLTLRRTPLHCHEVHY